MEQIQQTGHLHIRGLTFAPNGLQLVSWSDDGTVRFWDMSSDMCQPVHAETLNINTEVLVYSPCKKMIAWSFNNDDGKDIDAHIHIFGT